MNRGLDVVPGKFSHQRVPEPKLRRREAKKISKCRDWFWDGGRILDLWMGIKINMLNILNLISKMIKKFLCYKISRQ